MAESYRGLTIRIGGDTTKLQKALKTSESAAAGAQQEIRKLGDALKMDPSNVEAYNMQLGYMGDKATATAMRLQQLKVASEQIGSMGVNLTASKTMSEPVEKLAAATEDAHMRATQAKAAYNKVTDSLADMYTTLTKYNQAAADTFNINASKLMSSLKIDSADFNLREIGNELQSMFDEFSDVIEPLKRPISEVIAEMEELRAKFLETESVAKKAKFEKQFEKLREEITNVNGLKISFDFEGGTTNWEQLDRVFETLEDVSGLDPSQIARFRAEIARLKSEYVGAMDELQKANAVAQWSDLQAEILKAQASVKDIAKALADMRVPSDLMRSMTELTEKSDALKSSFNKSMGTGRSSESAYSINPGNVQAQDAAMLAFAEAERLAAERADVLREQISQFDRSKIDEYTDATKSSELQLIEASVAHSEAAERLNNYRGAVQATIYSLNQLGLDADEVAKILEGAEGFKFEYAMSTEDTKRQEFLDWVNRLIDALSSYRQEAEATGDAGLVSNVDDQVRQLEALEDATRNLQKAQEDERITKEALEYSKQRSELSGLDSDLVHATGDIDAARVAMQKLAAGEIKPHVDTTELDKLKEARAELERYGSSVGKSFDGVANDLKVLGGIIDSSTDRAKSLMAAFTADPSNTDAITLAVSATDEALAACNIRAEELREIINSYTPDKVNQVAIDTNTIGINAERAAHQVEEAFHNVDNARKRADELAKQYSEALKSAEGSDGGADNSIVRNIKEQLDEAQAEFERLQKVANDALSNLDIANATKELQSYKSELVQVEQTYRDVARIRDQAAQAEAIAVDFGDTSKIDEMGTELDAAAKRAKALDEALKLDPKNIELARQKTDAFNDVAALAKKRTDAIKQAIDSYDTSKVKKLRDEYGSVGEALRVTSDAFRRIEVAASKTEAELDELLKDAGLENMRDDIIANANAFDSQLTPEIREAVAALNALRAASSDASAELSNAASASRYEGLIDASARTATTANLDNIKTDEAAFQQALGRMADYAERAGRHIVESANTIDSAYRDMRKTVNGTEQEFESLRSAAIEFSQTHAVSADEILSMEALGGQLGIAVENLQQFGRIASNLNIATDLEADDVALKLGQISNIMSDIDDTDSLERFGDALVRLGNNAAAQESAIMNVAQRIAAVANVTSMSSAQVLGWSAAVAETGQRSESAATAIVNTIEGIGNAVAAGGNTLESFAQIAGMSADKFKEAWESGSSEALEAFVKGLGTLTDDSTDAIEALDAVGISSVRQETALLALSQTVANLDDNIKMSENAFNGVSDQWGAAGDAAREAQNKSEGFSGALQILKNNASNLAASLGDSLVGPMRTLASLLSMATYVLNEMPAPIRTIIVTTGGLSIALGTLVPVVDQFIKGWKSFASIGAVKAALDAASTALGNLKAALGATTANAAAAEASMGGVAMASGAASTAVAATGAAATGTSAAMGAAAAATKAFSAALNAIPGVAVLTAITAGVYMLTSEIGAVHERLTLLDKAATTTKSTAESLGNAYSEQLSSIDVSAGTQSLKEMRDETNKLISSFVEFGEHINETWSSVGASEGVAEAYANKIKELSASGNLTSEQMAELRNAVEEYNSVTGASVQITNDETGALNLNEQQLDSVTEAYKRYAEAKAYADLYNETMKRQVEINQEVTETQAELDAMLNKYGVSLGNGYTFMLWNVNESRELESRLDALNAEYDRNASRLTEYSNNMNDASSSAMDFESAMASAGMSAMDFSSLTDQEKANLADIQAHLVAAGETLANYSSINVSELAKIARAWNGNVNTIISALNKAKKAQDSLSGTSSVPVSTKPMKTSDPEYKAEKKRLDQAYKQQQKAYDKAYKEQQKAYDKEYKARQKALDNEYKAHQKALDKEYKAAQKASQKYLKEYKKAQDEQVDAFKKATEERLKLLEEEYETKKRLLEEEYGKYDTGIDERIDAINAEQEAEDRAKKQQEQAEKIAELEAAVRRAKTNKKRAEAQKDLNEYLESIEAEHRKEDRQAQIEALKQQKSDLKDELAEKQEILKESYDTAKETYKESRDAELKVLQESLEAAYEVQQEAQQAQLESMKEAQQAQLEGMKEAQQSQLEAMKEAQQAELEAMKESQQAQLESMKEDNEQALSDFANHVSDTADKTADAFGEITKGAASAAADAMSGYANGIITGNENVDKALGSVSSFVAESLAGLSKNMGIEGQNVVMEYANGMARNSSEPVNVISKIMSSVLSTINSSTAYSVTSGAGLVANFAIGMSSKQNAVTAAARSIANAAARFLHHSVPDEGPLRDDDTWGGEMVQNYIDSMMSMEGELGRESRRLADTVANGFSPQGLAFDSDPINALIEDMRNKEDALATQAQRMAQIVENGFDPHLTIDAAYEAIDKINAGKIRRDQMVARAANVDNSTYAPVINITVPEMVIREEADIDRVSKAVATRVQRVLSSKIG